MNNAKLTMDVLALVLQDALQKRSKHIDWEVKAVIEGWDAKLVFHAVCSLVQPELHSYCQFDFVFYEDANITVKQLATRGLMAFDYVTHQFQDQVFGQLPLTEEEFIHDFTNF